VVVCLVLLLVGAPRSSGQEPEESAAKLTKHVIGDYGYWSRTQDSPYSAEQIPFSKLTHINHAGVGFDVNANLVVPDGFLEPRLIDKAHDSGVKVLLLLGGVAQIHRAEWV
jgi:GH18 family chitinase